MNFITFFSTPIFMVLVLCGVTIFCYSFIETVFVIRLYRSWYKLLLAGRLDARKAAKQRTFISIDFFSVQDRLKAIVFWYVVYFAVIFYVLYIANESVKTLTVLHPVEGFFFVGFNVLMLSMCVVHLVAYISLKEMFFGNKANDSKPPY